MDGVNDTLLKVHTFFVYIQMCVCVGEKKRVGGGNK